MTTKQEITEIAAAVTTSVMNAMETRFNGVEDKLMEEIRKAACPARASRT